MAYRLEKYNINPKYPIYKQVSHYYDICKYERKFTPTTMNGKITSINHFLRYSGIKHLDQLNNEIIEEYIAYQTNQGLKPRTINNRTKHILAMVRYYRDDEDMTFKHLRDKKIKKQIEAPSEKRAFTREIVYEALKYADREAWLLIKIIFDCGLRINELRMMRLEDLNGNRLTVHGKGRKNRFVVLSDEVVKRLQDWIKRENVTDYIWESRYFAHSGQPKTGDTLRRIIRKPFDNCNIYKLCPHELRHSYASDLADLGATTRSIQHALGHSREETTQIYLHELTPGKETRELYALKYSASEPELY